MQVPAALLLESLQVPQVASSCQAEQDWHFVDPAAENVSAGQSVHEENPSAECFPGGHNSQIDDPLFGANVPALHNTHSVEPVAAAI